MFYQIFNSPQVKIWAIVTYKHGIYELPHEFPNDIRLRILGNLEILGKFLNFKTLNQDIKSKRKFCRLLFS